MLLHTLVITSVLLHLTTAQQEGCSAPVTVTCKSCSNADQSTEFRALLGSTVTFDFEVKNVDFLLFTLTFGETDEIIVSPPNSMSSKGIRDGRLSAKMSNIEGESIEVKLTVSGVSPSDDGKVLNYNYRPWSMDVFVCSKVVRVSSPVVTTVETTKSVVTSKPAVVVEATTKLSLIPTTENRKFTTMKRKVPTTERRKPTSIEPKASTEDQIPTTRPRQEQTTETSPKTLDKEPTTPEPSAVNPTPTKKSLTTFAKQKSKTRSPQTGVAFRITLPKISSTSKTRIATKTTSRPSTRVTKTKSDQQPQGENTTPEPELEPTRAETFVVKTPVVPSKKSLNSEEESFGKSQSKPTTGKPEVTSESGKPEVTSESGKPEVTSEPGKPEVVVVEEPYEVVQDSSKSSASLVVGGCHRFVFVVSTLCTAVIARFVFH